MADFENAINDAVAAGDIPGCALIAINRDGTFKYSKTFGSTSMDPAKAKPMGFDTIMWVASCTKLMTSICAMQLVERGVLQLDETVYKHIPELESFTVIKGFTDAGEPVEEKHKQPITLRRLLSHSSGLTYDMMHPKSLAWLQHHKRLPNSSGKLLERFDCPLMYEPGEGWCYGSSIDYAGLLIERATNQTLEAYMKQNLWEPLGITDATFFLSKRPDLAARLADMSQRNPESGKCEPVTSRPIYTDGQGNEIADCLGGQGSFTCAQEYVKVLKAVLDCDVEREGNILRKASVDELFKPQLTEASKAELSATLTSPALRDVLGGLPGEVEKDHALGGVLQMGDGPDGKQSGTLIWGGLPNLTWWIDRKTGLCGLYAGQVLPAGDAKCVVLQRKFEAGMYAKLTKEKL